MTGTHSMNSNNNTSTTTKTTSTTTSMISHNEIRENDVLLGRGGQTNKHIGNKRYRTSVTDHQDEYLNARKKDKVLIARRIVAIVHQNGGRFLKQSSTTPNNNHDCWEEVADKRAQEKTSQALREGLDVRNQTVRKLGGAGAGGKRKDDDSSAASSCDGSPHHNHRGSNKRAKMSTAAATMVSPSVVSVDGGEAQLHVSFPPHLQLENNNNSNSSGGSNYYFASMPPARPVPFLSSHRQLSKSDITDACAV